MTILVTGATGTVGESITRRLLEAGQQVRALSRDADSARERLPAGVDVHAGSFDDAASLAAAMDGVDRMYLFAEADSVQNVTAAAKVAGLRRIVVLTSAKDERDGSNVVADAVKGTGLEWTVLEPGPFANNARDWWAGPIREHGAVRWVHPDASLAPIHEDDVADAAVAALLSDDHVGHEYYMTGPEALTQAEQVRVIGERIGATIPYQEISPDEAEQVLVGHGVPAQIAHWVVMVLGYAADGGPADVSRTAEQVTGKPGRTFAQWVADHESAFRA